MKSIWKFKLELSCEQDVQLPTGAKVLTAQYQNGSLFIWAVVDPMEVETGYRRFLIFGTGHEMSDVAMRYISTVQQGAFVWHVFERIV